MIQIVSAEFESRRLITPAGRDLYSQGSATFIANDASCANSSTARGLQICQPLLLNHMYYCKNRTLVELEAFCQSNRSDLQNTIATGTAPQRLRAAQQALTYQSGVLSQLKDLQVVCSHTAQIFLRTLIPGAKGDTSPLFISL